MSYVTDVSKNACSCKHWKYQRRPPDNRDCKHLIELRGFNLKQSSSSSMYTYAERKPDFMLLAQKCPKKKLYASEYVFSRKYDGIRIKITKDGKLITRNGVILNFPSIGKFEYDLDGELCMKEMNKQGHANVMREINEKKNLFNLNVYVFDVFVENVPFLERNELLDEISKSWPKNNNIKTVRIQKIVQHEFLLTNDFVQDELPHLIKECIKHNFEGIVVRIKNGLYNFEKRRNGLVMFKVKV
jgi:ATP-dependent DNA ligase